MVALNQMREYHPRNIPTARCSLAAAVFAGLCNLLCFAMINYNLYVVKIRIRHYPAIIMNYPEIIGECVWLSPLLALIIFRHVIVLAIPYAVILLIVTTRFFDRGIVTQKFDWADLLFYSLGIVSLVVVSIWITVRSAVFVQHLLKR
jgi:hypothetical protein